ncbi:MAG: GNAT family N-acetyltransferase [Desulfobacterales bacterium]|nr:GNAT family N-acetyltransferase [Desulfobacterales bacterium]
MQINISEFSIADYNQVLMLWKRCKGIGLSDADSKENLNAYLNRNPALSFVAKNANAVIGAVLCGHDGRRGYLHHLAVRHDCRNQGIGRSLIEKCLSGLKSIGIQKCHLFIFNTNDSGIRFWKKMGWDYRNDLSVISKEIE